LKACEHQNFYSTVKVHRLTDESGKVTAFAADIEIRCAECSLPFYFLGMKGGVNPSHPTCSADGLEARLPIQPAPKNFLL
jgi:hypothetical protein